MPRERVIILDEPSFPTPSAMDEEDLRAPEAQQFERLANVVRRVYILLRSETEGRDYEPGPRWDGGQDRHGRNHKSVWPRLARFFVERSIEPLRYMKAQFWHSSSGRKPLPNAMMSEAALDVYERYKKQIEGDLERWLRWEIGSVRSEMQPVQDGLGWAYIEALRWALTNERTVKASPLVRYCLAVEYGLDDIAGLYHDYALFQYAFQKQAYDAAWPEGAIPVVLQQEAQNLVERVLT
jgi:hypothetical protein